MAFELERMRLVGVSDNEEFGGRVFVYVPTSDTFTTILAPGFFDAYADSLNIGDVIYVKHANGWRLLTVATNSAGVVTTFAGQDGQDHIQSLSGPGAVDITTEITELTTTGADAFTLVDGAYIGQKKTVILIVDGGNAVLTPTNALGISTITFADAGDSVQLEWHSGGWAVIGQGGLTTGPLTA